MNKAVNSFMNRFCYLAAVMLLVVSNAFALNPFDIKCSLNAYDNPVCVLTQYEYVSEIDNAYSDATDYFPMATGKLSTWEEVVNAWNVIDGKIKEQVNATTDPKTYESVLLRLGSSIVFDDYSTDPSVCENVPSLDMTGSQLPHEFFGDGKTIKNFCKIVDNENTGFISKIQGTDFADAASSVRKVIFENAYVYSKDSWEKGASVVADSARYTIFSDVSVLNATVNGWKAAAVAVYCNNCKAETVTVSDVSINTPVDLFTTNTSGSREKTHKGGVFAYAVNVSISGASLTNVTLKHELNSYMPATGGGNLIYNGERFFGGAVGYLEINGQVEGNDPFISGVKTTNLSVGDGSYVGGLVGQLKVARAPLTMRGNVLKGTLASTCFGDLSVGGLVGLATDEQEIDLVRNDLDMSYSFDRGSCPAEFTSDGQVFKVGGLVGELQNTDGKTIAYANTVTMPISVNYSTGNAGASSGGLFGFLGAGGYAAVMDNTVTGDNTVKVPGRSSGSYDDIYVGGLIGSGQSYDYNNNGINVGMNVYRNSYEGNIDVELGDASSGDSDVGGLVGKIIGDDVFSIHSNVVMGSIKATGTNFTSGVGYVACGITVDNSDYYVANNLYVWDDASVNQEVAYAVDAYKANLDDAADHIFGNFRNAVGDLEATGTLDIRGTGKIVKEDGSTVNSGVLSSEDVESQVLLYLLNKGYATKLAGYVLNDENAYPSKYWVLKETSEENPDAKIVLSRTRNAFRVTIDISSVYASLDEDAKDNIAPYLIYTPAEAATSAPESYVMAAVTDKKGNLSSEFIEAVPAQATSAALMKANNGYMLSDLKSLSDDGDYTMASNPLLYVSYETLRYNNGANAEPDIVLLDNLEEAVVYFTPRIDTVRLYGVKSFIPNIMMGYNAAIPSEIRVNCKEDDEAGNCKEIYGRAANARTFDELANLLLTRYNTTDFRDTLHVIYTLADNDYNMIKVANKNKGSNLYFVSYGVKADGTDTLTFSAYYDDLTADKDAVQSAPWANYVYPEKMKGYKVKQWNADVWLLNLDAFADHWGTNSNEDAVNMVLYCYESVCDMGELADLIDGGKYAGVIDQEDEMLAVLDTLTLDGMRWKAKEKADAEPVHLERMTNAVLKSKQTSYLPFFYVDAEYEVINYTLSFEVPSADDNFFFGSRNGAVDWKSEGTYNVKMENADGKLDFPKAYKVGACVGWSTENSENPQGWSEFSEYIVSYLDEETNLQLDALDDESCEEPTAAATISYTDSRDADADPVGKVRLVQYLGDEPLAHEFEAGSMKLPLVNEDFLFVAKVRLAQGYKLDTLWATYSEKEIDDSPLAEAVDPGQAMMPRRAPETEKSIDLKKTLGETFTINPTKVENWKMHAQFVAKKYEIVFDLGREKTGLRLEDWFDSLKLTVDDGKNHDFPKTVYNNDGCIVGWRNEKSDKDEWTSASRGMWSMDDKTDSGYPIVYDYVDEGSNTLQAVWQDAKFCDSDFHGDDEHVGDYARVVFDTTGGTVEIWGMTFEESENEDGERVKTAVDSVLFNTDGKNYVLISDNWNGEDRIRVRMKPKAGYEVSDAPALYRDWNRTEDHYDSLEFIESLKDGGLVHASEYDQGYIKAGFILVDSSLVDTDSADFSQTLEIAGSATVQGSSVYISYKTSEFDVKRKAKVRVVLMDAYGVELDTTETMTVAEAPYSNFKVWYPLTPGKYVVKGILWDVRDSTAEFTTDFEVKAEIAASEGGWQMVALSDVDKSSIDWDDEDQLFFWWDEESRSGKYWQYQELGAKDSIGRLQGYWYNTLEGRSLKVKASAELAEGFVWNVDSVYSGWNMVANPYNWAVRLPSCLDAYVWRDGDYYPPENGLVGPYEALWIHASARDSIFVDAAPAFADGDYEEKCGDYADEPYEDAEGRDAEVVESRSVKKRYALKSASRESWSIQAVLSDGAGRHDAWNFMGVGKAYEGYEAPSGMGDHVELAVIDGKKRLAKSIVAAKAALAKSATEVEEPSYQWTLELSATSERFGYLKLNGLKGLASMGFHTYVTVDGRTSELAAGDSLRVLLKSGGTQAQVEVTRKSKVLTEKALEGLRFAQAGSNLNVAFTVRDELEGSRLVVDVLDMGGKVMATYSGVAVAGSNSAALAAPKTGLYMLRVRVANQQTAGKIVVK